MGEVVARAGRVYGTPMPCRILVVSAGALFVCIACGPPLAAPPAAARESATSEGPVSASSAPESTCALLARACHGHDKDGTVQHDCHMLGHHETDPVACEAKRAECIAACAGAAR